MPEFNNLLRIYKFTSAYTARKFASDANDEGCKADVVAGNRVTTDLPTNHELFKRYKEWIVE